MSQKKTSRLVCEEYCKEFPNTPDLTLAKKIFKENSKLFTNLERCRDIVRTIRGHHGNRLREETTDKTLFKPITHNYNPFNIPESHAENWEPYIISSSRTLIISDLHIPYHDINAITIALKFGQQKNVNCILIDGDLIDFHNQSRFEKDPRARHTNEEFEATRQFLRELRKAFPNAKIIYKEGNHCERWEKWLYVKAPEIFGDPEFTLEGRLKLGELGIDIIKEKRPVKIGKLTVLHGHELQGSGGVNPARATFLKTIDNVLIGHVHRSSQHTEPTMGGDVIVTTSMGCLCGMFPMFARVNKWNQGFAYVELDIKTGEYRLENLKIINGKVF
jgi:predicted phosphodiesterase